MGMEGILSILSSAAAQGAGKSLRRSLSADMSILSKKWADRRNIAQEEEEEESSRRPGQDEVWRAIQEAHKVAVPYTPVVALMRSYGSSSCLLSEKSLEICTESLGSETGSDGYSYPGDPEEEEEEHHHHHVVVMQEEVVMKKTGRDRTFPPPLPSLVMQANGEDGEQMQMQMQSHRQDGRLLLQAVSVASQTTYFHAHRHHGRLRLSLPAPQIHHHHHHMDEDEGEYVNNYYAQDQDDGSMGGGGGILLDRKNLVCSSRFTKAQNHVPLPLRPTPPHHHSLPSFNAYHYFWRDLSTANNIKLAPIHNPNRRSCNQTPLLLSHPYCIATT